MLQEYFLPLRNTGIIKLLGGGVNPIFAHGKNVYFPIFPHGKNGEKGIWKEREMNTFPSLSMGKMENDTFFSRAKMGLDPPQLLIYEKYHFNVKCYRNTFYHFLTQEL